MLQRLLFVVLLGCTLAAFTKDDAPKLQVAVTGRLAADTTWYLIYEDAKTKLQYSHAVCSGSDALRLRITNLGNVASNLSYQLWEGAAAKNISLFANQQLEGTCSEEYKTILMETIPAGSDTSSIKVNITYLP